MKRISVSSLLVELRVEPKDRMHQILAFFTL
jgi:hypothetical protein